MNILVTIILGIGLAFGTAQLKKFRQSVQGEIFCVAMYIIIALQCIWNHTIRIFSSNAIVSVIIMLILPFVIFFLYTILSTFIKSKKNEISKKDEKEEK